MNFKIPFILLFLFSTSANAQYKWYSHEITVGGGIHTSDQMFDGTHIGILEPTMSPYYNSVSMVLFADYKYHLSRGVSLGMYAAIEKGSGDWQYDYMLGRPDDWETFYLGTYSRRAYTIAPEATIYYMAREDCSFYTTIGAGVTIVRETDVYGANNYQNIAPGTAQANNRTHFNGYYSPLGMKFGRKLSGFMELGIGYKGMMNAGLSYSFGKAHQRHIPVVKDTTELKTQNTVASKHYDVHINYAYLIIYRTDNPAYFGKSYEKLAINDSCIIEMADESKYIIRILPGSQIDISNPVHGIFHFKAAGGRTYYLKARTSRKYMQVRALNDDTAKGESDAITDVHHREL